MSLLEYLENEMRPFSVLPLSAVDSLALSQLAMIDGAGIIPSLRERSILRLRRVGGLDGGADDGAAVAPRLLDRVDAIADRVHAVATRGARMADLLVAEGYDSMFTGLDQVNIKRELSLVAASPRFRELELRDHVSIFDERAHVQFSATCYVMPGEWAYVGFRGTDASFTGWREDFDMAIAPPVPAQRMAAAYLESVGRHLPRRIYVGGHSKGGNLAVYAAASCTAALRSRIARVFDHDGPGFKPGLIDAARLRPALEELEDRLDRTVPVDSVVGMLMEPCAPARAVWSDAAGIDQHSVFSWRIEAGELVCAPDVSASARGTHEVMADWLASFPDEELPRFVDALFRALEASGAQGVGQILGGGPRAGQRIAEAMRNIDQTDRDVLVPAFGRLASIAAERIARGAVAGVAQGIESLFP
ncbi:MAG: Mbeg1-like protein [Collinsella sp.]|nr:Mbeg1-like protein [Collinsella sp.]